MKIIGKILLGLLAFVLLIGLAAGGVGVYTVRSQFPQISGSAKLAGLTGSVEVIRDKFGVPHIYADTPQDLFRAQGFVHAQDRYFQMEFWRRIGQGRLAELFGVSALKQDKFIRTVGWHRTAAQEAQSMDASLRTVLESYAAGVNAYALNNTGKLGLEFKVLGLTGATWQPEAWQPENTLTWGKAMSWDLGGNLDTELIRAALLEKGGEALAQAVLPPYPQDAPVIVPTQTSLKEGLKVGRLAGLSASTQTFKPANLQTQDLLNTLNSLQSVIGGWRDEGIGSNNWVIGGARTTTGKPILADDPHLSVQMPSIWYQVGLHCRVVNASCPYDVVGVSFPGTPGVVIGHNARIAWGVTNVEPDTQDLYVEKPDPNNADAFEFMGKFEPAQIIEETINVQGKEPVKLKVRITRHGPIINDADGANYEDAKRQTQSVALKWAALEPGTLFKSVLGLNRAQNWDEFRTALRDWDTPAQNFVYADVDGNIGYQMPGRVPIRKSGNGAAPMPGWDGEHEWTGYIPFDELPKLFNPPQGFIVTANNAVVDDTYPYWITGDWERGYRARRITQLIESKDKWGVQDIREIHGDVQSGHADDVLPVVFKAVDGMPLASEVNTAVELLKKWDRRNTTDSAASTIFEAFWFKLAHKLFADDLGKEFAEDALSTNTPTKLAVKNALANPDLPYWDDVTTPAKEGQQAIILSALTETMTELKARLGNDTAQWQWGKVHQITFQNQTLGKSGVAPIEAIFNRGPFPIIGSSSAVNAQNHRPDFSVRSHPSWRMVVDLSNFNNSIAIHPTGQSGHAGHPHYDDMMQQWIAVQYNPFYWQRSEVEKKSEGTLVLTP